eukprot:scaffold2041_cov37-Cyclotella_meneghiniana.AAC.3
MYINTEKLARIIRDLDQLPEQEIYNITKNRGAHMRFMYVEGGILTQYAPICSPINLHKDFKPQADGESQNEFANIPEGVFDDDVDLEEPKEHENANNAKNEIEQQQTQQ